MTDLKDLLLKLYGALIDVIQAHNYEPPLRFRKMFHTNLEMRCFVGELGLK